MCVQRTAAGLISGRVDVAVRGEKDVHCVAVDVSVDEVLHASREHEDVVSVAADTLVFIDEIRGGVVGNHGRFCFEILQSFRKPLQKAAPTDGVLKTASSEPAEERACEAKGCGVCEEEAERDGAEHSPGQASTSGVMFGGRACGFEQVDVFNTRWTSGLARKASEAVRHFIREVCAGLESTFGDAAHEGDAAPWAIFLAMGGVVGRADWETHSAVHALLKLFRVDFGQQ